MSSQFFSWNFYSANNIFLNIFINLSRDATACLTRPDQTHLSCGSLSHCCSLYQGACLVIMSQLHQSQHISQCSTYRNGDARMLSSWDASKLDCAVAALSTVPVLVRDSPLSTSYTISRESVSSSSSFVQPGPRGTTKCVTGPRDPGIGCILDCSAGCRLHRSLSC